MHPDSTSMKRCSQCKITRPTTEFGPDKRASTGLRSECRGCRAKYAIDHHDRIVEYRRSHTPDLKQAARSARWRAAHPDKKREDTKRYRATYPEKNRAFTARHEARKRVAFVEDVSLTVLVERDRGICGICRKPVAERSRSIDHILPLAEGGQHSYANTRLTHLRCNVRRQHRGAAQLRMVG